MKTCECCKKKRVRILTMVSDYGNMILCKTCALLWGVRKEEWKRAWKAANIAREVGGVNFKYVAIISVDAARLVQPINDVETSINDTLSRCGVSEKLRIRTNLSVCVKVSRKLNKDEEDKMRKLLIESTDGQLSANAKIESFRCQSGKSCCNSSL